MTGGDALQASSAVLTMHRAAPTNPLKAATWIDAAMLPNQCCCPRQRFVAALLPLLTTRVEEYAVDQKDDTAAALSCSRLATTPCFGVVDETRRTYRHHGRQRDALGRIATLHHATLRVAPHRYARTAGDTRRLSRG